MAAAAATALVAGAAVGITRLGDDDTEQVTTGPAISCEDGDDLLALTIGMGGASPVPYHGAFSVAVTTSSSGSLDYLTNPETIVITDPSFSPGGDQVAVTWADGDYESAGPGSTSIWVVDTWDGNARPITLGPNDGTPNWSPDGNHIAYTHHLDGGGYQVRTVPPAGGDPNLLVEVSELTNGHGLAWSSDGETLVTWYSTSDSTGTMTGAVVLLVDLDGGSTEVARVEESFHNATPVPGTSDLLIDVFDPRTGSSGHEILDLTTGERRPVESPSGVVSFSRDGERTYMVVMTSAGTVGTGSADFDGQVISPHDPSIAEELYVTDISVGPCATGQDREHSQAADQPLIGTDWRLGPRRLAITAASGDGRCAAPQCTRLRIELDTSAGSDRSCMIVAGELRGESISVDSEPVSDPGPCTTGEPGVEGVDVPTRLVVSGDMVEIDLTRAMPDGRLHTRTETFGAFYTAE